MNLAQKLERVRIVRENFQGCAVCTKHAEIYERTSSVVQFS